ncbi:unnamed protein product [Ectocarpus sp. 12 AP-2014]
MRIAIGDGTFSPRYRLRPDKFFKVLDILAPPSSTPIHLPARTQGCTSRPR